MLKCREGGRIQNVSAVVATSVNADGCREILGLDVLTSDDGAGWTAFIRDLVARGLSGIRLAAVQEQGPPPPIPGDVQGGARAVRELCRADQCGLLFHDPRQQARLAEPGRGEARTRTGPRTGRPALAVERCRYSESVVVGSRPPRARSASTRGSVSGGSPAVALVSLKSCSCSNSPRTCADGTNDRARSRCVIWSSKKMCGSHRFENFGLVHAAEEDGLVHMHAPGSQSLDDALVRRRVPRRDERRSDRRLALDEPALDAAEGGQKRA